MSRLPDLQALWRIRPWRRCLPREIRRRRAAPVSSSEQGRQYARATTTTSVQVGHLVDCNPILKYSWVLVFSLVTLDFLEIKSLRSNLVVVIVKLNACEHGQSVV